MLADVGEIFCTDCPEPVTMASDFMSGRRGNCADIPYARSEGEHATSADCPLC